MYNREDRAGDLEFELLREKTNANLELAGALRSLISEARSHMPGPDTHSSSRLAVTIDRRILAALERQEKDPTLAHYPEFAVKLAARLQRMGLTVPGEEEQRRPGAAYRMFQAHLEHARDSGTGLYRVLSTWMKALGSLALWSLRRGPGAPSDFDEVTYLLAHSDIANSVAAGEFRTGYEHWLRFGQIESRVVHFRKKKLVLPASKRVRPRTGIPSDFDEDAYLFFNPDVANGVDQGWFPSGYEHWLGFGRAEGRVGGVWQPAPERSDSLPLMESRGYGVNFYGFLSATSGLGSGARGLARAFERAGIPAHMIDVPDWRDQAARRSPPPATPYRINLVQQNPDVFARFTRTYGADLFAGCYNIGHWVWELASARLDWRDLFSYVHEIWTPSEFCREAVQQATRLPVVRIPYVVEGLESQILYSRDHFQFPADVFVFGYIFDVSSYLDRKNPLCLIEAFRREFGDSPGVLLCLKFLNRKDDEGNIRALMEAIGGAPNIRIFNQMMDTNEITSLQSAFDCLVSPHRSEGFGLNLAEAMYLGKPVIATRYSANLDFMRDDNSYLIDCALTPIPQGIGPYLHGNLWADPSVAHVSHLMRLVFKDTAGRQERARRAAAAIRAAYSADAVGRLIANRFRELRLSERPLPPLAKQIPALRPPRLFHPGTPASVAEEIRAWTGKPVISVVTPIYNTPGRYLHQCIESVRAQYYPFWELCLCDDGSTNPETLDILASYQGLDPRIKIVRHGHNQGIARASNRAAEISMGGWLAFLDHDDELAPEALYELASAIHKNPEIDLLYTDEDKIDEAGTFVDHYCKPDWSPEHLLSVNYILHMLVVRKDLFYAAGQFRSEFSGAQDYDLVLRIASRTPAIHHVPKILYHWRMIPGSAAAEVDAKPEALEAGRRALQDHIRSYPGARIEPGLLPGLFRVRPAIRDNPLVSLCILASGREASIDERGKIDLIANFVCSIVDKTEYPNYEIVIIDDGNLSEATCRVLDTNRCRRVSFPGPNRPFNFSKKANFAWRQAKGRYVVLLNDDMEAVSGEWLTSMIELLQWESVGVVGAKLIFPDGRFQHAGLVIGVDGGAAHVYHGSPDVVGYNGFTHLIRNYSAVTGACMATRREVLELTGGFDENLAVDYNDVDFCLKAIQHGYRVVYTPYAELYHFEGTSLSRVKQNSQEVKVFAKKWASYIQHDPYYNPNLSRHGVEFSIEPEFACWPPSGVYLSKFLDEG